jgi:hypothetical protein
MSSSYQYFRSKTSDQTVILLAYLILIMHGFLGLSRAATQITESLLVLNELMMQLAVLKIVHQYLVRKYVQLRT